jgi:type II secretory ATPase GspE/PulE/Tfp pilus assembly ATPase PilB-like protein
MSTRSLLHSVKNSSVPRSSLFSGASEQLRKNMFFEEGVLYISKVWQGEPDVLSFLGLARRRGIVSVQYLETTEFQKRYARAMTISGEFRQSEVQEYARNLINTAYEQQASDIHIVDHGTYGTIRFRRLGMLYPHDEMPGDRTKHLIAVIHPIPTMGFFVLLRKTRVGRSWMRIKGCTCAGTARPS